METSDKREVFRLIGALEKALGRIGKTLKEMHDGGEMREGFRVLAKHARVMQASLHDYGTTLGIEHEPEEAE